MKAISRFILMIACLFVNVVYALDRTDTGFYYPIGTANFDSGGGTWLGRDSAHERPEEAPPYFNGFYHIGVDMLTAKGNDAYAVADGTAVYISRDSKSWGSGNCALVVEHWTNHKEVFTAVYGHLQCDKLPSSASFRAYQVYAGKSVGKIGRWDDGDHLHFAVHYGSFNGSNSIARSGWGMMPNSSWTDPCNGNDKCTNTFTDPVFFLKTHSPASLTSEGEKTLAQVGGGTYVLDGSPWCRQAGHVYLVAIGGDLDSSLTIAEEEADKMLACQKIDEINERIIRIGQDNGGTISASQVVGKDGDNQSIVSSFLSVITSAFHEVIALTVGTPTALALEPFVQRKLVSYRKGQVYRIDGTDKRIVILTDGPGQNGDKAIDKTAYAESKEGGTYNLGGSSASGKRPDPAVTDIWTERSSGNKHDAIGFGSTVCFGATIKNKGKADVPKDVKLSFFVSKGNREDKHPRHAGYTMVKAKNLRSGDKTKAVFCINAREDDYPSAYPGTFNFGAHVNSDGAITESDPNNNWMGGYVFTLTENAKLTLSQFWLSDTPKGGNTVTAFVTVRNTGTPFGSDKVNIQYRIAGPQYGEDPIILGFDQVKRGNLRTGDTRYEELSFVTPTMPGTYVLMAEIDYDHRVTESDRSGNTATLSFSIPDPGG